jgi:hypothetical protein
MPGILRASRGAGIRSSCGVRLLNFRSIARQVLRMSRALAADWLQA